MLNIFNTFIFILLKLLFFIIYTVFLFILFSVFIVFSFILKLKVSVNLIYIKYNIINFVYKIKINSFKYFL